MVFVLMPMSRCCFQDHGYLEQGLGLLLVWNLPSVVGLAGQVPLTLPYH